MDEIQFYCIACGASLSAQAEKAGGSCECTRCRRPAPVPGRPVSKPLLPPEILAVEIKFLTSCCRSKVRVDASSQGQAFDCPVCKAHAWIPVWSGLLAGSAPGEKPAVPAQPRVRLSAEECAFLTAPLRDREPALASADNR